MDEQIVSVLWKLYVFSLIRIFKELFFLLYKLSSFNSPDRQNTFALNESCTTLIVQRKVDDVEITRDTIESVLIFLCFYVSIFRALLKFFELSSFFRATFLRTSSLRKLCFCFSSWHSIRSHFFFHSIKSLSERNINRVLLLKELFVILIVIITSFIIMILVIAIHHIISLTSKYVHVLFVVLLHDLGLEICFKIHFWVS